MTNLNELNIPYVRKVNQLRPKNKEAFQYVARKITNNVMLSEDESDEMIEEILEDLLIAQSNGTTAQEFFGNDLDAFVEDLSEELPKRTFKSFLINIIFHLNMILIIAFSILGFTDVISIASEGKHIDLPIYSTIISVIAMIVLCAGSVFIKNPDTRKRTFISDLVSGILSYSIYGVFYISFNILNRPPYYKFPFYLSFILTGILIYSFIKMKRKYYPKKQFI